MENESESGPAGLKYSHVLDTELTATERRYLAEVYADLCRLDNMTRGVYAEVLVAEALPGASRPSDLRGPTRGGRMPSLRRSIPVLPEKSHTWTSV
jgi:hypothetical protein